MLPLIRSNTPSPFQSTARGARRSWYHSSGPQKLPRVGDSIMQNVSSGVPSTKFSRRGAS